MVPDGAPKIALSWFISGLTMVYGRYNELVFMGIRMVYKPTNITGGGPSCMCFVLVLSFSKTRRIA